MKATLRGIVQFRPIVGGGLFKKKERERKRPYVCVRSRIGRVHSLRLIVLFCFFTKEEKSSKEIRSAQRLV